jgi:hypothetical protein
LHAAVLLAPRATFGEADFKKLRADAIRLLERLTEGTPEAWVTAEAKKSLERVGK